MRCGVWAHVGGLRIPSLQWLLMNPDGEHLETGYQPLPMLYIAYLLIWLSLALLQVGLG